MTNAEQLIDLLFKLYNLSEKQVQQMQNNIPEIDAELKDYSWEDIRDKVNLYYARKNDKSRPTIAQILALLETDSSISKVYDGPVYHYNRPKTNLFVITATFEKLVDILIDGGALPNQEGKFTNNRSIVDPATDLVVLQPIKWLVAKTDIAMMERPECFLPYQFASPLERVAVALQNRLFTFKLRDWSKLSQQNVGGTL